LFSEFVTAVPCLEGQLPKDAWARLLRSEAIVRRVQGKPWMPLLDTAVGIWSDLEVQPYLLELFERQPVAGTTGVPIPDDAVLFVDGVLVAAVPEIRGEHVAQVWRDGRWRTAYLVDAPIPAAWLAPDAAPVDTGPKTWSPASRGTVGASIGPSFGRQLVEDPADWLGDQRQLGGWTGAVTTGVLPIAHQAGVYWDASVAAQLLSIRKGTTDEWGLDPARLLPAVYAGPALVLEDVTVGVGGGGFLALQYVGEQSEVVAYPQPDVSVTVRQGRADVAVNAGATAAAMHAGLGVGSIASTEKALVLRVGVDADLGLGWFTEEPPGTRPASALTLVTAFRVDAAWGRDR
jgi:hypothetical protein